MIHAISYVLFILPFTAWLGFELRRKHVLKQYWGWVLGAFIVGVIGDQVSYYYYGVGGNFFLHASGGSAATLLFIYMTKTLKLHFNWRLNFILLFAFVCSLGVLNEIAEYALELVGIGRYSYDTHDVWRDLVANTTGMIITWSSVGLFGAAWKKLKVLKD